MILMQRLIRSLGVVEGVVIDTVDNYQGYENSIILLSLGMFSPSLSLSLISLSHDFFMIRSLTLSSLIYLLAVPKNMVLKKIYLGFFKTS